MIKKFGAFFLGFGLAGVLTLGLFLAFLFTGAGEHPLFHDQKLPSGKEIKVASFHLVWGIEHDERTKENDQFAIEYVSSPGTAPAGRDAEALQVFELVRVISEQWGFRKASVSAFPTTTRRGAYSIYNFTRAPDGSWSHEKRDAKVYAND